ncbi:hypothetical protein V6N13_061883 [Hibiscus sabdariffa]
MEDSAFQISEALVKLYEWKGHYKMAIESDSELVVSWLQNPSNAPEVFKPLIQASVKVGEHLQWSISVVPRECNSLADSLAEQGISRAKDLVEFSVGGI